MQNQLQIFSDTEFGELGVLMVDGKPYFPASTCAKALGYASPRDAIIKHCRYVAKRDVPHPQNPERMLKVNFIPEGDLYRLIVHSRLPSAQRFESFVFDRILPSVRQYGAYLTDEAIHNLIHHPDFAFKVFEAMLEERRKNEALQEELAAILPKSRYCDEILCAENAIQITVIAKDYGLSGAALNKLLHEMGIQFKIGRTWILYQDYAGKGYTRTATYKITENESVVHTLWTQSGRMFLYNKLREKGLLPLEEL